ncbi:hypothetical protein [Phytoactinopolyspora halotolerans]|uniref:Uncharacterized protein n=1 Tax=Phytoactinopolyspora halotolerans TaxID=1981512 RepID=A0A6L9SDC4_9ACTN|nr:hypothetical protein [Phytoactinopolyspora halotolerans]NEE03069.1 hypothetical protein [Phytoactinopolyspora halotolerans]
MMKIESERREAVLASAVLRSRRRAAQRRGRRLAASVRTTSALRLAASTRMSPER